MYAIHLIVDRYHVATPVETILEVLRDRIRRSRGRGVKVSRREERSILRAARARHAANRKLFINVMTGRV